ncbi:CDP-glycerol glycerophosphotransferase family protein [Virgibacillus sp. 179-BFC.A HS]|uniref:CDP-glycerol glycerophosphotransferase family protein n=1 Tax=Tigheibacillus jepli TaxID=3035914 RepID=A0ABU5CE55_9BACI|nr:CDP-glycerol glycerophosphotransferase family protein [Virgibacillus sp. 179-BFC.A HS]MDY0404610.1 CDP-glycerol glycerophosphotransferase family protein [Virgibacillus sp. 179-BFC.A HS]
MLKELIIFIYLIIFRGVFLFFRLFPIKRDKTTFVASFEDNILYTIRDVEKLTSENMVVLRLSKRKVTIAQNKRITVLEFSAPHVWHWVRSVYHLATSRLVFVDNYYGFLAAANFQRGVPVIQLWHAAGAIKRFGRCDPSAKTRSALAKYRFRRVYQRFDHVVVGCEKMAGIFRKAFGIGEERILRTGVPRTDFFFDTEAITREREKFSREFPAICEKQVILYAPTFRAGQKTATALPLDLHKMCQALCDDYILFLHLHPAVKVDIAVDNRDFVKNVSGYHNINHLLTFTDILITDYSSIPFEFSLMKRPMIFYAYDLEDYKKQSGYWEDYEQMVPGPIATDTNDIIELIRHHRFDLQAVEAFAKEWNQYSSGQSSQALVNRFYDKTL